MHSLGLVPLIAIFVGAAGAVWVAGVKVSQATDVLSRRLGWGRALGGLVALAIVTNLPEAAIVMSGAIRGDLSLAVGNILGGIAAQTVVLALLDRFGPRGRGPLMYRAASMTLVLEGLLVVIVLALVVAGTQVPSTLIAFRLSPVPVLIAAVWLLGIRLIARQGAQTPWRLDSAGAEHRPQDASGANLDRPHRSTRRVAVVFVIAALVTLVAGLLLEQSSDAIAGHLGMSGAVFGATVLAAATSLPELSTGLTSVRMGDDAMAVSDIFGGNAFLPVLFLPAVIVSGSTVLPAAHASDIFLTASGMALTVIYLVGLILRPQKRVLGMGVDSALVVGGYLVTVAGLAVL